MRRKKQFFFEKKNQKTFANFPPSPFVGRVGVGAMMAIIIPAYTKC
jgi:hypothetical protein